MYSIRDTLTPQPALRCTIADYNYTIRDGRLLKYSIPTWMLRALAVLKCTAVQSNRAPVSYTHLTLPTSHGV